MTKTNTKAAPAKAPAKATVAKLSAKAPAKATVAKLSAKAAPAKAAVAKLSAKAAPAKAAVAKLSAKAAPAKGAKSPNPAARKATSMRMANAAIRRRLATARESYALAAFATDKTAGTETAAQGDYAAALNVALMPLSELADNGHWTGFRLKEAGDNAKAVYRDTLELERTTFYEMAKAKGLSAEAARKRFSRTRDCAFALFLKANPRVAKAEATKEKAKHATSVRYLKALKTAYRTVMKDNDAPEDLLDINAALGKLLASLGVDLTTLNG